MSPGDAAPGRVPGVLALMLPIFDPAQERRPAPLLGLGHGMASRRPQMIQDETPLDDVSIDETYYVIDEPPAARAPARDPMDYRVVREQLAEAVPPAPRFQLYWTAPADLDWDD